MFYDFSATVPDSLITSFQPLIEEVTYCCITVLPMVSKCNVIDLLEFLGCEFESDRVHIEKILIH